ncbi:MAG: O-antigen ligase family protein, partial [Minisyncoccia bacterium]
MTLEKFLRGIVLTGVFALPFIVLYVANSMFFPFITGKNFAFRILVEIVTGAWVCLALIKSEYRPRPSMLLWGFAAFLVLIGISDIFGTYPSKSFWSNYERMEGWVTLAHLFAYFIVTTSILNTEKLWRYWWNTSLAVSVLVSLYGVIQLAGLATINQGGIRLDSRFGNSTYLAVYMLFHVFMAALLLARAWVEKGPGKRAAAVWVYGSVIALNTFILFFTATRGAILGLMGGAVLTALILIVLAPRSRVAWRAGTIIIGFIVLVVGFWFVRDQAWVRKIEPLHRLATIYSEGFPVGRFLNAQMALKGFEERPILGWGQENYSSVFDKHYDPRMYAQEQWFDRTHNILLDWLIAGGILGLLAYLSLYLFALLALWRSGAFALYERAILTGLIAGYFFYLIFTFDNITSYLFFVSLLAYIVVRSQALDTKENSTGPVPPQMLPIVSAVMVFVVCGVIWFVNASMIGANRTLIQAISPQTGGPSKNLEIFKEAFLYPRAGMQEIREQLAQAAMGILSAEGVSDDVKQQFVVLAMEEMKKQEIEGPLNARAPFFLGILLDRAGAYPDAKAALDRARAISPHKQGILFEMGLNASARGANEEALAFFKEAYELESEYQEARIYYAATLIRLSKDTEADELLAPMIEAGSLSDQRIASAYAARNRFDKIVTIWNAYTAKNPENTDARFLLAGAYYSGGDSAGAIKTLEAMKLDIPAAAAQADALITQIKT